MTAVEAAAAPRTRVPQRIAPRWLVPATAAVAVAEFVVLRVVTRTLVHIPGLERAEGPARVVAEVGRTGYYLAGILLVALLAAIIAQRRATAPRLAITAGLFLGVGALARAGALSRSVTAALVLVVVALAAGPALARWSGPRRLPLAAFLLAFTAAGLHGTAQLATGDGVVVGASPLLAVAEVLAVTGALGAPLMVPPGGRRAARWGLGVGLGALGILVAAGSTSRILLLWNLGLAGWLPDLAYAAAAGSLTYTALAALRVGRTRVVAGMLLLVCGGIGLHSTYQSGLVVAGLLVLGTSPRPSQPVRSPRPGPRRPSPAPRSRPGSRRS